MQAKLLKDIFLTANKTKKAGDIIDVIVGNDLNLYIEYRTCCSKGTRQLTQDEYELIDENQSNGQTDDPI